MKDKKKVLLNLDEPDKFGVILKSSKETKESIMKEKTVELELKIVYPEKIMGIESNVIIDAYKKSSSISLLVGMNVLSGLILDSLTDLRVKLSKDKFENYFSTPFPGNAKEKNTGTITEINDEKIKAKFSEKIDNKILDLIKNGEYSVVPRFYFRKKDNEIKCIPITFDIVSNDLVSDYFETIKNFIINKERRNI